MSNNLFVSPVKNSGSLIEVEFVFSFKLRMKQNNINDEF